MSPDRLSERIRASAGWAAFGDALGFITELTRASGLRSRVGAEHVENTAPWKRRVGGRNGPTVVLPAGTLSDDTQLRLASSRAIRGDGTFDVELFSKIELTTFPAYAMGAGRGTLSAAAALKRRGATWFANYFDDGGVKYIHCGGNGAAMRIHPHVWHTLNLRSADQMVLEVISNAVCTHGHPRGIVGAVFHAFCLREAVRKGVPGPETLVALAEELGVVSRVISEDTKLGTLWQTQWERESRRSFDGAVEEVILEILKDLQQAADATSREPAQVYRSAVDQLDAKNPKQRGSGTKTAILAAIAAWLFEGDPLQGMQVVANELGTDTDSIATMAGALVGPRAGESLPGPVADLEYVMLEADRMAVLAQRELVGTFPYPDLLEWSSPKTAADCVGLGEREPHMAGLGPAEPTHEEFGGTGKGAFTWQWLGLWFGQHILAKRRLHPKPLPSSQRVHASREYVTPSLWALDKKGEINQLPKGVDPAGSSPNLHQLTDEAIASNFDPVVIGRALLALAEKSTGIEDSVAFAAIIAKAKKTRSDRGR